MIPGTFIALEGTDGSGKGTQAKLLVDRLEQTGHKTMAVAFPRHGTPAGYFVDRYLRGEYGSWEAVGAKKVSMFFALDRLDASGNIKEALAAGKIVIADRYTFSNMGHQGAKIADKEERKKFFLWDYELEFQTLGIPKPDLNILLQVPTRTAYDFIAKKGEREYLAGAPRDIHEADLSHLEAANRAYLEVAELFPNDFRLIECTDHARLLSVQEVHEKIWGIVSEMFLKIDHSTKSRTDSIIG